MTCIERAGPIDAKASNTGKIEVMTNRSATAGDRMAILHPRPVDSGICLRMGGTMHDLPVSATDRVTAPPAALAMQRHFRHKPPADRHPAGG